MILIEAYFHKNPDYISTPNTEPYFKVLEVSGEWIDDEDWGLIKTALYDVSDDYSDEWIRFVVVRKWSNDGHGGCQDMWVELINANGKPYYPDNGYNDETRYPAEL